MTALSNLRSEQPHAVGILATAIRSGRMHHAYLLAGPEEAGADRLAAAVSASLVCTERRDADACGECAGCRKQAGGNHPDVLFVAPDDKGNIGIDTVRSLSGRLALRAAESVIKVAILERADAMKPPAQNALLKTLEEPPGATCFLLTSARMRMLLPTVRSRCQTVRLAPQRREGAWRTLVEAGVAPEVARSIAALVGPDTRRAQSMLDRGAEEIVSHLRQALRAGTPLGDLIRIAADLGADRERADLALAFLEVEVRDRLARAHGATSELLFTEPDASGPTANLSAAAAKLTEARRYRTFNANRTLAFENILLAAAGHGQPQPGTTR